MMIAIEYQLDTAWRRRIARAAAMDPDMPLRPPATVSGVLDHLLVVGRESSPAGSEVPTQ